MYLTCLFLLLLTELENDVVDNATGVETSGFTT